MSEVLAITGRVLPVTTADVQLVAEFENGASVTGESKIFYCKKREDCRIRRVRLSPENPKALPAALAAIREADMIVLGPGSLYTSIIPQPAGGRHCRGHPGLRRPEDLRVQCYDPGRGDGGVYGLGPYLRPVPPFLPEPLRHLPVQLLAHSQGGGGQVCPGGRLAPVRRRRPLCCAGRGGHQPAPSPRWTTALSAMIPGIWPGN